MWVTGGLFLSGLDKGEVAWLCLPSSWPCLSWCSAGLFLSARMVTGPGWLPGASLFSFSVQKTARPQGLFLGRMLGLHHDPSDSIWSHSNSGHGSLPPAHPGRQVSKPRALRCGPAALVKETSGPCGLLKMGLHKLSQGPLPRPLLQFV